MDLPAVHLSDRPNVLRPTTAGRWRGHHSLQLLRCRWILEQVRHSKWLNCFTLILKRISLMNSIIYIIGLVVVIVAVLSFFGFR